MDLPLTQHKVLTDPGLLPLRSDLHNGHNQSEPYRLSNRLRIPMKAHLFA